MPETTTAAILNFAKAGASLWGIRRSLVEGDHRNSVGKHFVSTGRDFGVIKRTLNRHGIVVPEEEHPSDFETDEECEQDHDQAKRGKMGSADKEDDGDDDEEDGNAMDNKDGGEQVTTAYNDDDEKEEEGGKEDDDEDVDDEEEEDERAGVEMERSAVPAGRTRGKAPVQYNDDATFKQLLRQNGACSQSQARKRSSSSASQAAPKRAMAHRPPATSSSASQRPAASRAAEPRKQPAAKKARDAEAAAQSGCEGIKVFNSISMRYSRFEPSLSFRSLCAAVKAAFEIDDAWCEL